MIHSFDSVQTTACSPAEVKAKRSARACEPTILRRDAHPIPTHPRCYERWPGKREKRWHLVPVMVLLAVEACCISSVAHAALPDERATLPPLPLTHVPTILACSQENYTGLRRALEEALARVGLTPSITAVPSIEPQSVAAAASETGDRRIRIWIDAVQQDRVTLYLADRTRDRMFVRTLTLENELDSVSIDLLGFILESSIEALLAGRAIGVARSDYIRSLTPTAPTSRAPESPPCRVRGDCSMGTWQVGIGYETAPLDGVVFQHGPLLGVSRQLNAWHLGAAGRLRWPIVLETPDVGASFNSSGMMLLGGLALARSASTALVVEAGVGADITFIKPYARTLGAEGTQPFWAFDPFARASVAARLSVGSWHFAAVAGVEWMILPARYVVEIDSLSRTVVEPWALRPLAGLGVALTLF